MSLFGRIVTGVDVRNAGLDIVKTWADTYLAEIGRETARGAAALPRFRSVFGANDLDRWEEDQLPAAVVVAPGLLGEPMQRGKRWAARWAMGIGVVVSGPTRSDTMDLVALYCGAVRAAVLQHPSLDGFAAGTYWIGERYDEMPTRDERTIGAGRVLFAVDVEGVVDSVGGPMAVPADPIADPGDWGLVGATSTTVEAKEG